jgi:hypothetical protein
MIRGRMKGLELTYPCIFIISHLPLDVVLDIWPSSKQEDYATRMPANVRNSGLNHKIMMRL